jgi:hypothetical protein
VEGLGWWFGLAPATMKFRVRLPNESNKANRRTLCCKYRVPLRVPAHEVLIIGFFR